MKQHFNNGQEYLMVEVPEGAYRFYSNKGVIEKRVGIDVSERMPDNSLRIYGHGILIPEGQYSFVGLASFLTEEQAGEVVALAKGYGYRNYECEDYNGGSSPFDVWAAYHLNTALESLRSLLSSHGMQGETLFLKRVK